MFLVILVSKFGHWVFFVILHELLLFAAVGVAGGKPTFAAGARQSSSLRVSGRSRGLSRQGDRCFKEASFFRMPTQLDSAVKPQDIEKRHVRSCCL